jgi:ribosomal protein S18 acetylase RimI-like enzyme
LGATVNIRTAGVDDAPKIAALVEAAYAKWVPIAGRRPLPMDADYAAALREHRFDLLFAGETLAGLIETTPDEGRLLIVNVAVAPAFQGRGFGRRLMALAEEIAVGEALGGPWLYTNKLFAPNIALYERLGYRIESEIEVAPGVVRVNMGKAAGVS